MSAMGAITASPFIVTPETVPANEYEFEACLASWEWRIFSGQLYKIMTKSADEDDEDAVGVVVPFKPNSAQRTFLATLWYRNIILKARQLGFTTLIAIMWLDHALFNANQRCGIIAHNKEAATEIFRDKIRFAYDNLPDQLRERFPLKKASETMLQFGHNNSAIRVGVSLRSGTFQRLHVSEMGKVAAKFPEKAIEIVTGSLPTVPNDGIAVIESTAEGRSGKFYDLATKAEKQKERRKKLARNDFRFHFFPWWKAREYRADPRFVPISPTEHEYFDKVEAIMDCAISDSQRAWYISKRDNDLGGDAELMWREFPSTPAECWQQSTDGVYYARQLATARVQGRIGRFPVVSRVKVNTFWDIGAGDGTGIWLHQHVGGQDRFLRYIEGWDEGYAHYVKALKDLGHLYGTMFLPHDAGAKRQMKDTIASPLSMLQELAPDWSFTIVPRVETFQHGIDLTRAAFSTAYFDEEGCKEGLDHLSQYKKRWNQRLGVWGVEPEADHIHTEAADSFRQWAQGYDPSIEHMSRRPKRRTKGGMAA